jgi:Fe-S cluster assembly protein SufD
VGKGAASETILIEVVAETSAAVSFPRVVVVADEMAEASVIVHLRSPEGVDAIVVPHLEVVAGDASNVKVSVVQNLGTTTRSIARCRAVVGRDAGLALAEAGLGGALSRLHLTVDLEGRGSSANIVGAYFGDNQQVLDYRYFMHHAGLNTSSNMFLKGAVEDEALSVFTGMIRIDEEAQKTDAYQTNRNLILSEGAAAQSVPNLEILANDVKCGHGSTMGPLDQEQRYYLMSRGLDPKRADRLQVRGFFQEALAKFPHPNLVQPLAEWINAKFITAQEEGRL